MTFGETPCFLITSTECWNENYIFCINNNMCSWSLAMSHNFLVNNSESKSTGKKAEARLENKLRGNLNINQSRKSTQQRVSCYWKTVLFHLSEALLLFFPNKQPLYPYSYRQWVEPWVIMWHRPVGMWCVECHVNQGNGRLTFENDLRSGGLAHFTAEWTSVHTELANSMVFQEEPMGGWVSERWPCTFTSSSLKCYQQVAVGSLWIVYDLMDLILQL